MPLETVLVTGGAGFIGSALCRTLLAQLPSSVKTALITHTHLDAKQLVRAIAEDLGIETQGLSEYDTMRKLTGEAPTNMRDFVRLHAGEFKQRAAAHS